MATTRSASHDLSPESRGLAPRIWHWVTSALATPIPYFAILSMAYLFWHEPWSDETRAWILVRDLTGIPALFRELHYEGHPSAWYFLLMPLAKLGLPFVAARVLHAGLAIGAVALLWTRSPFSRLERWLLPFGYFLAFEYNAISRGYVAIVLILFALAALDARRMRTPLTHAALLAVLANITIHSLIIAGFLALGYAFEQWRQGSWTKRTWVAAGIAAVGMLASVLTVWPLPHDLQPDIVPWHFGSSSIASLLRAVYIGFIPVPSSNHAFWDTSGLSALAYPAKVMLAGGLLVGSFLVMGRSRLVLAMYAATTAALLFFMAFKWYGGDRHAGLIFINFLFFFWLAKSRANEAPGLEQKHKTSPKIVVSMRHCAMACLSLLLIGQVVATGVAVRAEATGTFSAGPETAEYLKENGYLDNKTMVSFYRSDRVTSVIAALDDPHVRFFLPESRSFRTYARWTTDMDYQQGLVRPLDEVLARMDAANVAHRPQVLVLGVDPPGSATAWARLQVLANFTDVVGTDALRVYSVT